MHLLKYSLGVAVTGSDGIINIFKHNKIKCYIHLSFVWNYAEIEKDKIVLHSHKYRVPFVNVSVSAS